jgi:small-conductance mechanosensitive channel
VPSVTTAISTALRLIEKSLRGHESCARRRPVVFVLRFGDGINLELGVWISRSGAARIICAPAGVAIHKSFAEPGIRMPYPRRDIGCWTWKPAPPAAIRSKTPLGGICKF